jgi:hypothetical protein
LRVSVPSAAVAGAEAHQEGVRLPLPPVNAAEP